MFYKESAIPSLLMATQQQIPPSTMYVFTEPFSIGHVVFKISANRDPKNTTARPNGRKLNNSLFRILRFSGPSLLSMTSSTI